MEDLRAFLAMAWAFLKTPFTLYGYTFTFAGIMLLAVAAGWLVFVWVHWVLD